MNYRIIVFLCMVASSGLEAATVEQLMMPAWLERDGQRTALRAGQNLDSGDQIVSGNNARVVLRLEEGSTVKLGADARLDLSTLEPASEDQGIFTGVMKVVRGAFRFTTTAVGKNKRRNIRTQLGALTIGIRGTDVWGKTAPDQDFVVLIEGAIDVEQNGNTARMDEALSIVRAPRDENMAAATQVDMNDLARWGAETEPTAGAGISSADGSWLLNVASWQNPTSAETAALRLNELGFAAQTETTEIDNATWHRLVIPGLSSRADAVALGEQLAGKTGFNSAWPARR